MITAKQRSDMLEAAKPLINWMNQNCHPHCIVQVEQTTVELLEGVSSAHTYEFQRDKPGPVVVPFNADANLMNALHGEAYGVDWVYLTEEEHALSLKIAGV